MLKSLLTDYGPRWAANRALYSAKLRLMNAVPAAESLFEHDVCVSRVDLFDKIIDFANEEAFLASLSDDQQADIIARADQAVHGVIRAFSSIELSYGDPIDWFTSPTTKASIDPTLPWYRIPDFSEQTGDIKVVWEISRFSHLLLLSRAALLTHNASYHEAFSQQISSWLAANEYGCGPNYKCGQEASLRMFNVLMAYSCFRYLGMATEEDARCVRGIVEGSFRKVLSNFFYARRCIRNNHTLSEACGMYVGAWCCGDVETMAKAMRYFEEAVDFQFRNDGGYVQWSFNYQRFALQICELFYVVLRADGRHLSGDTLRRIQKSAELLYQFQDEATGMLPNYGSNDGALPFQLSQCDFRDYSPTINSVLSLICGWTPYEKALLSEEAIWFGASEVMVKPVHRFSCMFPEAGLSILRNEDTFVTLCAQDYLSNRPGHLDQLHIDVWHGGENTLCDGGTYSYASEEGRYLMSTGAHNTLMVGSQEQMGIRPPFLVYDWGERSDFAIGASAIEACETFGAGYTHRRIVELNDDVIAVTDEVTGCEDAHRELRFHTRRKVTIDGTTAVLTSRGADELVLSFASDGLVSLTSEETFVSNRYMALDDGVVVIARYEPGTTRVCTHLRFRNELH